MTDNRVAAAAAKARWAKGQDPKTHSEALAELHEARVARAIAEASAAYPGMPRDSIQRLRKQLDSWDGVEPGRPEDPAERYVRFWFHPRRASIGEILHRTGKTVTAKFAEGTYKFQERSDGQYRMVWRPLDSEALEFISDPDGLL